MRVWLTLAVFFAAIAALTGCEERLRPGFPHRAHLTAKRCGGPGEPGCPTCATCHAGLRVSEAEALPREHECMRCHERDTPRILGAVTAKSARRTPITFDHRAHLALPGIAGQCVSCHGGVTEDGADGGVFPPMARCTECHEDALTSNACASCHPRPALRRLVPETFLRHDAAFLRDHGLLAAGHQATCDQCHTESACAACHDQRQPLGAAARFPDEVTREFIHRGDFLVRHAIEARAAPAQCVQCHTVSFCDSCHVARGVSGNAAGAINPHPIGWVGPDPLSPTFHGRAARRDIVACAGCHERGPATNCIRCHKAGGPGGNPHPNGWSSQRAPADAMCRWCHGP